MKLLVKGQSIEWINQMLTVSGSEGVYQVEFEFEDETGLPSWDECTKYAVFKNSGVPKYQSGVLAIIDENGIAEIPACVLTHPGKFCVGVTGEKEYVIMPTIWADPVRIEAGCAEGEAGGETVYSAAKNAIKYGEDAQVWAKGGYLVRRVSGATGDPVIERQVQRTKGAKDYAEDAEGAQSAAESAAGGAAAAKEAAERAETAAAGSATLAESYAKGGTGTRSGEDTDNAKYYNEQAAAEKQAAAQQASDAAGSATLAQSYTKGGTGSRFGENTDNAKYYKEQAAAEKQAAAQQASDAAGSATLAQSYAKGGTGTRSGEDADNALYYMGKALEYMQGAQAAYNNMVFVDKDDNNKMYNITFFKQNGHFGIGLTAAAQ